jgi:predicted DNA-binding transcriptional regulator AlpA
MQNKQPLTLPQAAKIVGMQKDLFYYYVKDGRGPNHIQIGSRYLFEEADLQGWKPIPKPLGAPKKASKA